MDLKVTFLKRYYQTLLKINRLTERDRVFLLFLIGIMLLGFWYLTVFNLQLKSISDSKQQIEVIQGQFDAINQKKMLINNLITNPDAAQLMTHYQELTTQMTELDDEVKNFNKRYINTRDLAKLLHDILKQTFGVTIVDFSTVMPPPVIPSQQTAAEQKNKVTLSLEPIHYRLAMRGSYFAIMNYLKRLEQLPWHLYWDKFDYTVEKYPEGIVVIEFYTLKPIDPFKPNTQQGGKS